MEFELRAEKNCLKVIRKSLVTSGSVNVYQVKITFSTDWNGLDRRVVFWAVGNGTKVTVEPDADGVCTIPWEVLTEPGQLLYAGVYGTSGEAVVLPTVWAVLGQIVRGSAPDEGSGPPTPDAWQQLKDDLKEATEKLEDIEGYTTAAGESAAQAGSAADAAGGYAQSAAGAEAEARRQAAAAGTSAGAAGQSAQAAEEARQGAVKAAGEAAGAVTEQLSGYVKDAETAKEGAETARDDAGGSATAAAGSAAEALESANTAKQYSGNPAIPQNGTWWKWDADKQVYVDTGEPANVNPRGEYDPEAVYKQWDLVRRAGSSYLALRSGLQGVLPIEGPDWMCVLERCGKSAYEQAVDAGLTATEGEFKSALAKMVDIYGDWKAGLTDDELSDPDIVYAASRPKDWMPMPALEDVQDGEFWLLFQWLPGDVTECSFTMQAKSDIKVEAGRCVDGAFTPLEKYTKDYHPASATANTTVPISLDGADFGDMTSEGRVQAMVRVSGELTGIAIATKYARYVDGIVSAQDLVTLTLGNYSYLTYFCIKNMSSVPDTIAFRYSSVLLAVRGTAVGFNHLTDASLVFSFCYALCAIPLDITFELAAKVSNGDNGGVFQDCYALRKVPSGLDLKMVSSDSRRAFSNCMSLRALPSWSFPSARTLETAFRGAGFQRIVNLYIPLCANLTGTFNDLTLLGQFTFDPRMETWDTPQDIGLANTALSHGAIVEFFNSLPTIETPKTITLTNTPGASQVTAEDVAIATAKGWLVAGVPAGIATGSPGGTEGPEIFSLEDRVKALEENSAQKQDVQAVWDQMAAAYAEGVNEA